jgi:hypothetical protein
MTTRAYECWPYQKPDWVRVVYAESRGKAKAERLRDLNECCDFLYTDMACRVLKRFSYNESAEAFANNAKYRCIQFAYLGMAVEVEGKRGMIVGHNDSANLDVLFENGNVLNCHPWWRIKYFDELGNLVKEFRKGREEK